MGSTWGVSWGFAWGDTWGAIEVTYGGGTRGAAARRRARELERKRLEEESTLALILFL